MDSKWWESHFSWLKSEVTGNHCCTESEIDAYRDGCIHGLVYTHISPCSSSWEGVETMTPKEQ